MCWFFGSRCFCLRVHSRNKNILFFFCRNTQTVSATNAISIPRKIYFHSLCLRFFWTIEFFLMLKFSRRHLISISQSFCFFESKDEFYLFVSYVWITQIPVFICEMRSKFGKFDEKKTGWLNWVKCVLVKCDKCFVCLNRERRNKSAQTISVESGWETLHRSNDSTLFIYLIMEYTERLSIFEMFTF